MCPAEVIVLYVEVLFACSTLIIKCNDALLDRCPIIGKDTAVCAYHSEDICLLLVIFVFQNPTLKNAHNMINSTKRSEILVFNCYLCYVSFLLTCYVCSTKIGEFLTYPSVSRTLFLRNLEFSQEFMLRN